MRKMTNESFGAVHTGSLKGNKKKNIKGITLVALVVTIVILLILAGISIAALTQTGLFGKAKQAEQKSKDAQELENSTLGSYENSINEIVSTGSREENSNNNQYSLEEKAIGTWINGKTIYRKVYKYDSSFYINVDVWTDSGFVNDNVDIILDTRVFGGNYGVYSPIQSSVNGTVGIKKNSLALYSKTSLWIDYIILDYTKNQY